MNHNGQNGSNLAKSPKVVLDQINKGIIRKNAFECLISGKKLTCVKFSGAFDGIIKNTHIMRTIALWEICMLYIYLN